MINVDWTYIICSERFEKERYVWWRQWLDTNKVKGSVEFYKWASELSNEEIDNICVRDGTLEALYPWRSGYPLRPAEISIGINFMKIFEDAYKNKYNTIMILESDVILHPNFLGIMNSILENIKDVAYDSLSFGCGMGLRLQPQNQMYLAQVDQFRCADSLIFKKNAINYFYKNINKIKIPIDEEFSQAAKKGDISVLWLEPPIAVQQSQMINNYSSIQNGNYNLTIPWS